MRVQGRRGRHLVKVVAIGINHAGVDTAHNIILRNVAANTSRPAARRCPMQLQYTSGRNPFSSGKPSPVVNPW